jgi:hypothetical protein
VNLPGSLRTASSRQTGDAIGQFTRFPVSVTPRRPQRLTTPIRKGVGLDPRVEVCDRDAGLSFPTHLVTVRHRKAASSEASSTLGLASSDPCEAEIRQGMDGSPQHRASPPPRSTAAIMAR